MKSHRTTFRLAILLIFGLALSSGCGLLGEGPSEEGDGAFDEIDLSGGDDGTGEDENGENGEDVEFDEIDLSMRCPEDPVIYGVYLDYQLNIDEDDGYIHERTDPSVGVPVEIHGSEAAGSVPANTFPVTIPVTIEGVSGQCTISGMAEISLAIHGTCEDGVATLDIEGEYEIYHRSVQCPGRPSIDYTESAFPGPSVTADFILSNSGDTFDWSQNAGAVEFIYKWTLKPMIGFLEIDE